MTGTLTAASRFFATAIVGQDATLSAPKRDPEWFVVGERAYSGYADSESRYYLKSLAGKESFPIPPSELKNFSVWCPYEGDKDKTMELIRDIIKDVEAEMDKEGQEQEASGAQSSKDKKERENVRFQKVLIKALQLTNDRKEPWCRVSTTQTSPWGAVEDSSQLNPPAFNLTDSMWDRDSVKFCEMNDSWLRGLQTVLPQQIESMIIREWEKSGGKSWDEEKTGKFRKALENCLTSFNVYYNPMTGVYDISQDPKSLCLQALDMVLPASGATDQTQSAGWTWFPTTTDKPKTPREELEQYMNSYLLNMPWTSWVQRYSVCDPMVNANWWVKTFYNVAGSAVTWAIGLYTSATVAISLVLQRFGYAVTAWGITKFLFGPKTWFNRFKSWGKKAAEKLSDDKKGPKGPKGPPPAPAAEPKKTTAPEEKKEPLVDDTAQKVAFTALAGYMLYKMGKIVLDTSRFAAPAAAFVPVTPDMPVWKCGAMNGDDEGCAEWREQERKRAFNDLML